MSSAIVDLSHHDLEKWDLKKAAQILRGNFNISLVLLMLSYNNVSTYITYEILIFYNLIFRRTKDQKPFLFHGDSIIHQQQ